MTDHLQRQIDEALRAARRGAKSATSSAPLVDFAVEITLERFENAVLRDKTIGSPAAWAFRVARNVVLRVGLQRTRQSGQGASEDRSDSLPAGLRAQLQAWLREHRASLTAKQFEIASVLAGGLSLHQAARKLGRDRTNLRRMFRAVLRRLAATQRP
jgi:hypothetical protein